MSFISRAQRLQHFYGRLNTWLTDKHRLQPPCQCLVLLNTLPILVQRSCPNTLELAPSQRWFQHIASINGSLSSASANHSMHLINKQDNLAAGLTNLVHHRLQPLLKLTPKLAASNQRPHIQSNYPFVLKGIRHITSRHFLGQAFSNSRFADTGLADNYGVILGAPSQYLHHPFYLIITPNDRIEFSLTS